MLKKTKNNFKLIKQMLQNMGLRYIGFRISFEFKKKIGLMKKQFPTNPAEKEWISLANWKQSKSKFFFENKNEISVRKRPTEKLKTQFNKNWDGIFTFFSAIDFNLSKEYNWLTNPNNGYCYSLKHWTEISDYSPDMGDIKFVWEKSRFTYLYNIIRYDYHFAENNSRFVFDEIISWIDNNPINQGPNWICSQEISIRVLNWTFALYYYKDSENLTDRIFQRIMHSIYWQIHHVYENINFSRIAVRNNHAITETLTLYLVGMIYPHFPNSAKWKKKGKTWFEKEIEYQIYEDGTFLQFSMNYHRVVIQLLTWALVLAEKNKEKFSEIVYERAKKSLYFLQVCQEETSGQLPNYGANDGALFFPLSNAEYRNYIPQLNALHNYFYKNNYTKNIEFHEDTEWYFGNTNNSFTKLEFRGIFSFDKGGFYVIKEEKSLSFIRCGSHKDRPSQADNLHIDIWVNGKNILRDAGSYKYNTSPELLMYFMGTQSHNTVMLGNNDQMEKGPRFIWFDWSQTISSKLFETDNYFEFEGTINVFKHMSNDIFHTRKIRKYKNSLHWVVNDNISQRKNLNIFQIWNINDDFLDYFEIDSISNNKIISPVEKGAYFSSYYGSKVNSKQLIFCTDINNITTTIKSLINEDIINTSVLFGGK